MKKRITLIAEIGWNFIGDLDIAKNMIIAAAESGADLVKFQYWKESNLKAGLWDTDGRREIYKKAQLDINKYNKLRGIANESNVNSFCSVFSLIDAKELASNGDKIIKIPSHESYNLPLIEFSLDTFSEVYLSVGALSKDELDILTKYSKYENLTVMHCVSSYPLLADNVNLYKLKYLSTIFNSVGYSGHYEGIEDATSAICLDSKIIEKHFTIDKNLPGRDNKFALLPDQFRELSNFRDKYIQMSVDRGLDLQDSEVDIVKNYRGRWATNEN